MPVDYKLMFELTYFEWLFCIPLKLGDSPTEGAEKIEQKGVQQSLEFK